MFLRKVKKKISNKVKGIHITDFSGKKADWESWSEMFLSCEKHKGYKKLLVSYGSMVGVDEISTMLLRMTQTLIKKLMKLGELNELAYKNLTISINTSSSMGSLELPERNSKIAWDSVSIKYALHTASSWLKLESKFQNSKLVLIEKDLDEWTSISEGVRIQMNKFKSNVLAMMILWPTYSKTYLRNMMSSWIDLRIASHQVALVIEYWGHSKKLNYRYKKIRKKMKRRKKCKGLCSLWETVQKQVPWLW